MLPCVQVSASAHLGPRGILQGPQVDIESPEAAAQTLELQEAAFLFLSCGNSKSSSRIQLWGNSYMNFSQLRLSVRTQQENDDKKIHNTESSKWNESALKMEKMKYRRKNSYEFEGGTSWRCLTNCCIYFKKFPSRRGEIACIPEVENNARNNI